MSQVLFAKPATHPPVPLPTISATDLLFQPSTAHGTVSVHLPPQALAEFPTGWPRSQDMAFACTDLSSEQLDLLPDIPRDGIIAVVVEIGWASGYVDEEQPPRVMLTVDGDGTAVYPLDNVWPWLGTEWYPTASLFETEQGD